MSLDPRDIPENFRCVDPLGGGVDEGEELRCDACGFSSRKIGALSYVWERTNQTALPPTIELCESCNQAATQ